MAQVARSKLKLLYLARIMENETDEDHGITAAGIIEKLSEIGIDVERKTVYRDLECLRQFGYDIIREDDHRPTTYKLASREFQDQELFLLADAVQSSRFLTQSKCNALVRSIGKLGSKYMADGLRKRVHVEGRVKGHGNETVFYGIDAIQRAMNAKRKVSFTYHKHDAHGKLVARRSGAPYLETPVQLMYMNDEYYLVVWNDKHGEFTNYRVDRMRNIEVSDVPATRNEKIATFNVAEYQQRVFDMFSGEAINVELSVEPGAVSALIDRFGGDVEIAYEEDGRSHVRVWVMEAPTFYGWLATLGQAVRIESPDTLADAYRSYLQGIIDSYRK